MILLHLFALQSRFNRVQIQDDEESKKVAQRHIHLLVFVNDDPLLGADFFSYTSISHLWWVFDASGQIDDVLFDQGHYQKVAIKSSSNSLLFALLLRNISMI